MDRKIIIDLIELWQNKISDSIEKYRDYLSFDSLSEKEFIEECVETIAQYYDNEWLGETTNYDNIVSDTAKIL